MSYVSYKERKPKFIDNKTFVRRIKRMFNECYKSIHESTLFIKCQEQFTQSEEGFGYNDINDFIESIIPESSGFDGDVFGDNAMKYSSFQNETVILCIEVYGNMLFKLCDSNTMNEAYLNCANKIKIAFDRYLLTLGYKIDIRAGNVSILPLELPIPLEEIEDEEIKEEYMKYHSFKLINNVDEKKKIILFIATKLDECDKQINEVFGSKTRGLYRYYVNSFDIRHTNQWFKDMSIEEKIKWYDYIYAFLMIIFVNKANLTDNKVGK